ncbi:hypothetical protein MKX01_019384 [Papaver californicum]|nr:hypothetical protein MKX01_019384 [Papaver californicum]
MEEVRSSSAWVATHSSHVVVDTSDKYLNYDKLASGLKEALEKDKSVFDADRLQKYTGPQLRELLKWPRPLPLEDERVRLLHEVGKELERNFGGKAVNIVSPVENLRCHLLPLLPAIFLVFGITQCIKVTSSTLSSIIEANNEIGSGTEEEVELRACSIYAVEKMRELIKIKSGKQVLSVELDLWLWAYGIQFPSLQHHRTHSIYY